MSPRRCSGEGILESLVCLTGCRVGTVRNDCASFPVGIAFTYIKREPFFCQYILSSRSFLKSKI
jgi:hypothetical protein